MDNLNGRGKLNRKQDHILICHHCIQEAVHTTSHDNSGPKRKLLVQSVKRPSQKHQEIKQNCQNQLGQNSGKQSEVATTK